MLCQLTLKKNRTSDRQINVLQIKTGPALHIVILFILLSYCYRAMLNIVMLLILLSFCYKTIEMSSYLQFKFKCYLLKLQIKTNIFLIIIF